MNAFDRKPKKPLAVCPKCGMDSGERKCTVNLPERYFIRCGSCGHIVGGYNTQASATAAWNKESKARWANDRE